MLVHTFKDYEQVFATDSKLYVLNYSKEKVSYTDVIVYDLFSQKVDKTIEFNKKVSSIGADALGRIYLAGPAESGYDIYLLSSEGELLSQTTSKQTIYTFYGFDSTNGNFYVNSYEQGKNAVRAGNVTGNEISFSGTVLQFMAQSREPTRLQQVEVLGDKYLCMDSTIQPGLYIWDSNAYSIKEEKDTCMVVLPRKVVGNSYLNANAGVGVRAVCRKNTDSIISFKDNTSIAEYDIKTGEEIASAATSYPVFSLVEYKDGVAAIEKNGSDFYFEYFPWKNATTVQITGSTADMKVGENLKLSTVTDSLLAENFTWTSSDSKVASVKQSGEVSSWHKGTVTISVKNKRGLSAEYTIHVLENEAIKDPTQPAVIVSGTQTENASSNDYTVRSKTVNSYLIENADKTLTRIEYQDKKVLVEQYAVEGSTLLSSKTIDSELELFGGFYSGSDANFLVFGNKNETESDTSEVIRIVKYSKDWNRIASCSVNGANTYIPFDAGSLRMTETDGRLYIHTCHEMYASEDGVHHQANMTFVVKESDLTIEQSYYDVMNIAQAGYVSHSFNQFVKTDGKYVYRVDHGDAGPRAVSITKCKTDGKIEDVSYIYAVDLSNVFGYNETGVSVGGFELSSENCILVGNGVDFTKENVFPFEKRNIFVNISSTELNCSDTIWLTNYTYNDNITVSTPHLTKIGADSFLVMWEETDRKEEITYTQMLTIDGSGTITSNQVASDMCLSDCEPIVCSDGLVRWYAAEEGAPVMYAVNPFHLETSHIHIYNKGEITKEATCTENGVKTYQCIKCNDTKQEEIATKEHLYDKGKVTKQPTKDSEGEKTYTCINCGETKTEKIEKNSSIFYEITIHSYNKGEITKEPTCTENGVRTYQCTKCNYTKQEEIAAKGHSYDNGKVTKQPTEDSEGEKTYTCINCGETKIEKIEKISSSTSESADKKPKEVTIVSVKSPKKAQIKVIWKKDSEVSGYQIVCATNSKFTKGKVSSTVSGSKASHTIKKLSKGKKYYVKVRAYKTINGKKVYGDYGKVRTVTAKKK